MKVKCKDVGPSSNLVHYTEGKIYDVTFDGGWGWIRSNIGNRLSIWNKRHEDFESSATWEIVDETDIIKISEEESHYWEKIEKETKTDEERFAEILDEMLETYIEKNKRYGDSFYETYKKYGNISLLIRIEDKLARIRKLLLDNIVDTLDESVSDSLLDLANYCVLSRLSLEKDKNER